MKKVLALTALLCCIISGVAFSACGDSGTVPIDEISIVAPSSTSIRAGETFTLGYTTVPEEAAESIKVNWEISDSRRLSYKNGEFTALTCGTVKVTARVKGNEAYDEIELKVIAPAGFNSYSGNGYSLVYPSNWSASTVGTVRSWSAATGFPNMNVVTEMLNPSYMTASASTFQSTYESTYTLMGFTVNFTQPVTVEKSKYLGVERVKVTSAYSLYSSGTTTNIRQIQLIFNNSDKNLSCVLTLTFKEIYYGNSAVQLQDTIFSQFMPA